MSPYKGIKRLYFRYCCPSDQEAGIAGLSFMRGIPGAVISCVGLIFLPVLIVLGMGWFYFTYSKVPAMRRLIAENALTVLRKTGDSFFPMPAPLKPVADDVAYVSIGNSADNAFATRMRTDARAEGACDGQESTRCTLARWLGCSRGRQFAPHSAATSSSTS